MHPSDLVPNILRCVLTRVHATRLHFRSYKTRGGTSTHARDALFPLPSPLACFTTHTRRETTPWGRFGTPSLLARPPPSPSRVQV